ncbi:hypothetical protein D9C73_026190 [Collichthys lucidus]|uniref:Uncharacterized protein n=1 Tax=Collichthys lucidus TaxID=240159 RepID=A0A4U5VTH1_COLLU|nr:hypothetical protein D9C73_026190 [Collichthys lucidus]
MVRISRSGEAADDSRPSDRAREGSSRLQRLLRVGETPLRAPPTTEVHHHNHPAPLHSEAAPELRFPGKHNTGERGVSPAPSTTAGFKATPLQSGESKRRKRRRANPLHGEDAGRRSSVRADEK